MARWFTWTVSREVRGVVRKGVLGGLRAQPPTKPGLPEGLSTGLASLTGGHCDGPSRLVDNSIRPASRRRGPGPNGGAGRPSPPRAYGRPGNHVANASQHVRTITVRARSG